jgi:hypothetical protein
MSAFDHDGPSPLSILFVWVISFTVTIGTFFILELKHADFCYNKANRHCGSKMVSLFPELCWQNGDVRTLNVAQHNQRSVEASTLSCSSML